MGRVGGANPGRKAHTVIHSIVAGGDCIDDADMLRAGSTQKILGHNVMAPSTLGTFLRAFTIGHVRQLDKMTETVLTRAWTAGAGPGDLPMTIDLDSTICEVHGDTKAGASYGYTKKLGYHPLLATRADTGEILHAWMRKGAAHTGRNASRFVDELAGRVRRAGASGQLTIRADSGFYSNTVIDRCRHHNIAFSITIPQNRNVQSAISMINQDTWIDIDYPDSGIAQVAETVYGNDRLIVRRTRIVGD